MNAAYGHLPAELLVCPALDEPVLVRLVADAFIAVQGRNALHVILLKFRELHRSSDTGRLGLAEKRPTHSELRELRISHISDGMSSDVST